MKLQSLGTGAGFLKAGFLGFAGSGKTYTSTQVAIGTRTLFGLDGPIAMFDTEGGAQYIAEIVRQETGKDLVGVQTRSLSDAIEFIRECESSGVSVAIIDSVTHIWREICDSYKDQVNEQRMKAGKNKLMRLTFQDWGVIKEKWSQFNDAYLNSRLHIIIAGRAGFDYDYEDVDDTGKKELIKTGVKMKTESEFGYEPSLLVQMERVQLVENNKLQPTILHRATVLKDRFGFIDGKQFDNPGFDFFKAHIALLKKGAHVQIDTTKQTPMGVDENGADDWAREKRQRQIFSEEIMGILVATWPGQSAADKKAKADVLNEVFGTRSWTAIENTQSAKLKDGLDVLPAAILRYCEKSNEQETETQTSGKSRKKATVTND